jgi:hypothetical protein
VREVTGKGLVFSFKVSWVSWWGLWWNQVPVGSWVRRRLTHFISKIPTLVSSKRKESQILPKKPFEYKVKWKYLPTTHTSSYGRTDQSCLSTRRGRLHTHRIIASAGDVEQRIRLDFWWSFSMRWRRSFFKPLLPSSSCLSRNSFLMPTSFSLESRRTRQFILRLSFEKSGSLFLPFLHQSRPFHLWRRSNKKILKSVHSFLEKNKVLPLIHSKSISLLALLLLILL